MIYVYDWQAEAAEPRPALAQAVRRAAPDRRNHASHMQYEYRYLQDIFPASSILMPASQHSQPATPNPPLVENDAACSTCCLLRIRAHAGRRSGAIDLKQLRKEAVVYARILPPLSIALQ